MNTLERVLQEIEETIERYGKNPYIDEDITKMCYGLTIAKNIIKKHLSENKCGECSRRKFYQMGYEECKKENEWVPCSVRMPDKQDECYGEKGYIVQVEDIIEAFSAYWDGEKFTDDEDNIVKYVIAWRPLPEPYKPDLESADGKRQREREEFFSEYKDGE